MENVGSVSVARTKFLNFMYVYESVRKPGFVYELTEYKAKDNLYRCVGCRRLGKCRYITIVNEVVVSSTKHPEDDHICEPIPVEGTFRLLKIRV